jgi:hypothetical protein
VTLLLLLAVQTGLRLSELTSLDRQSIVLNTGAHVRCHGKSRKERCTPLTKQTVATLKTWLKESVRGNTHALFPNIHGGRLSSDAVQYLLTKYVAIAKRRCPSLRQKRVTPHCLRHSSAMELLQAGVDTSVIALWLGHESVETTQIYLRSHLALMPVPEKAESGFPCENEHDSSCLLEQGGQHGWRSHIRRICVGEWWKRSKVALTIPEAAEQCGVSISSVVRFLKLHRETGSISSAQFGGYKDFALAEHEDLVRQMVAEQPDITLAELGKRLAKKKIAASKSSISRFLHHLQLRF